MTTPELELTESGNDSLNKFWEKIAENDDAFALAMSEYNNYPDVKKVTNNQAVLVRIDEQPAFMKDGGLPLEFGDQIVAQSRKHLGQGELMSIDCHDLDNIGNASTHGLEPFSFLFLQNTVVKVALNDATNTIIDYQAFSGGSHTVENVAQYLKKQEAFRLLTAALLQCEVTGVGQVLWPDHANNMEEEKQLVPDGQDAIIKGTNHQTDSYSAFIEGDGTPVLVNGLSATTLLSEKLVRKNLNTVVFAGLAGNYCVLYSAESARLAQELTILSQKGTSVDWESAIKNRVESRDDMSVSEEQFALMFEMVRKYIEFGMQIDPNVQICVALDHTDVVRGPAGISNQKDVDTLIQKYQSMGVSLVTM